MTLVRAWKAGFVGIFVVAGMACSSEGTPGGGGPDGERAPAATLDEQLAQVAGQVPEFGGMFVADNGKLGIYLLDPVAAPAATQAIAAMFGSENTIDRGVTIVPAQYGFGQLKRWHEGMVSLFDLDGVVSTDIDEARNRITVGVERMTLAGAVELELARLGIARAAVTIEPAEPIRMVATLRDRVRPLAGGLQINFPGFLCTLGFNAVRAGVSGFVTNSHCTANQGGVDGTKYWQPLESVDPALIGTEIADPTYLKSNCPGTIKGKNCRYSDSAFVQHDAAAATSPGSLAKLDAPGGSLTIAGTFTIVGEGVAIAGATTVNKVGRTTGWSQGTVSSTCVNTGVQGSRIVQLCQNHVSAAVGSGDSGSPVFERINDAEGAPTDSVRLHGILWGGNSSGTSFVFSPIANVQRAGELGALTTLAP
jgi:hypothetical protein